MVNNKKIQDFKNGRFVPMPISVLLGLSDFIAFCLSVTFTRYIFLDILNLNPVYKPESMLSDHSYEGLYYLFFIFCSISYFAFKGHYSIRLPWFSQVGTIVKTLLFMFFLDAFIQINTSSEIFVVPQIFLWSLTLSALLLTRYTSLTLAKKIKGWFLPICVVGNAPTILDFLYSLNSDGHTGYDVYQILLLNPDGRPLDPSALPSNFLNVPVIKGELDALDFITNHKDLFCILDMGEIAKSRNKNLFEYINETNGNWAYLPNVKFLNVYGMEPHYFFGNDVMILHKRSKIDMPASRFLKRLIDIVCSSFGLTLLLLLTIAVWVSRKLNKSDVPIFYGGARLGKNGVSFSCWKFCTMKRDADKILKDLLDKNDDLKEEWEKYQKLKNDPRIDSQISSLLRKTSLDELPQLWNVFVGDMSLVGPRPILADQREVYGKKIDSYFAVRPGLTGLWQVSGRNSTTFEQRVYWDGWYSKNWSLWHDIVILFKTVKVFVTGDGAY